jgi:hypothetical protein
VGEVEHWPLAGPFTPIDNCQDFLKRPELQDLSVLVRKMGFKDEGREWSKQQDQSRFGPFTNKLLPFLQLERVQCGEANTTTSGSSSSNDQQPPQPHADGWQLVVDAASLRQWVWSWSLQARSYLKGIEEVRRSKAAAAAQGG